MTTDRPITLPAGWQITRHDDGAIAVVGPDSIGGCVVRENEGDPRVIPTDILYHFADAILADLAASTPAGAADEIELLRDCLGFFASVIKSGEPWTQTCQLQYDQALAGRRLFTHPAAPVSASTPSAPAAPDGRLHADGYFTWNKGKRPDYIADRGLPCDFYLAAPAAPVGQAEPVAWLRNLTDPQPGAVTNLKYRSAAEVDSGVQYIPVYATPQAARPAADFPADFPFYELKFIQRVLNHEGTAPREDWQTARGMAMSIFEQWHAHASARPAAQGAQPAEPSELSSHQIEKGWHQTFSTNNPFCPCDLKSFTKAVRWAERAARAAQGEIPSSGAEGSK